MNENKTNINWYPGHMAKSRRNIEEKLKMVDLVIEVVDARIPVSSRIKDADILLKNKPHLIVMTKSDLCDLSVTKKWVEKYESENRRVVLANLLDAKKAVSEIRTNIEKMMNHQNNKRAEKGMLKKIPRVMIIGIPNVGKSTLINALTGRKATIVGNTPGVTRQISWIKLEDMQLLDTPGILYPKLENDTAFNLAALSAIKESILPVDEVTWYILKTLYKYYPEKLEQRYGVKDMDGDYEEIYTVIAQKLGCLRSGGNIDYDRIEKTIMSDLRNGVISKITFDRI